MLYGSNTKETAVTTEQKQTADEARYQAEVAVNKEEVGAAVRSQLMVR